jgi:hypothetical protein
VKKIVNLILMLVMVSMMFWPWQQTQAAPVFSTFRYWRAFRKELDDYLYNYRAPVGSGNTCIRTKDRPDGTPDCLREETILEIEMQFNDPNNDGKDDDSYYKIRDPYARRVHLQEVDLADPSKNFFKNQKQHPYIMKKVVMAFEEKTVYEVYTDNGSAKNNWTVAAAVVGAISKTLGFVGENPQDHWCLPRVTNRVLVSGDPYTGAYLYSLKPKREILQSDLDYIYLTARMEKFGFLNTPDQKEWTADEVIALQPIVDLGNKVYNTMRTQKVDAVMARIRVASQEAAWIELGVLGAEAEGGVYLAKEAAAKVGQFGLLTSEDITKIFYQSGMATDSATINAAANELSTALNTVARANEATTGKTAATLINDFKQYVLVMNTSGKFGGGPGTLFPLPTITIYDINFSNPYLPNTVNHGIAAGLEFNLLWLQGEKDASVTFKIFMATEFARKDAAASRLAMTMNPFPYLDAHFDGLVRLYERRGFTRAQALSRLYTIKNNGSWLQINTDLGRANFVQDFDTKITE